MQPGLLAKVIVGIILPGVFGISFVLPGDAAAAVPPPATECSLAKARAVVAAYGCVASQMKRQLLGQSADFARCSDALVRAFVTAERVSTCPTTGDAASAYSTVELTENMVLAALHVDTASGLKQLACVIRKNKASVKFASCESRLLGQRLGDSRNPPGPSFENCRTQLYDRFSAIEGCDSSVDFFEVAEAASRSAGYYPGVVMRNSLFLSPILVGADFRGADLTGTSFENGILAESNFARATMDNVHLYAMDAEGSNFEGVSVWRLRATISDLNQAIFSGATLVESSFSETNLDRADFSGASLADSVFGRVELNEAELLGADFADVRVFDKVEATGLLNCPASLPPGWICTSGFLIGRTASLPGADLHGLDLAAVDLAGAYLEGADLSGVNLSGANLTAVHANGADLTGADLTGSNLTRLRASMLTGCPAFVPPSWTCTANAMLGPTASLPSVDLSGADLHGVDLTEAFLSNANLEGANLAGAGLAGAYLYSASLAGAILDHANLSNVDLFLADLTGASLAYGTLAGAQVESSTLRSVNWTEAICPDGVRAEAPVLDCCDHYLGDPPRICE